MQAVDLAQVETMEVESALDPARRVRVAFPFSSSTGTAASAAVYFELDPGTHVGVHTDSSEEFLVILEGSGEGLVGDETAPVHAGQVVLVPPMVRHDITNTGDGPLRVFGTFAGSTNVATFEEPVAPGGPQVFVIGAPVPVALPLEVAQPA
ncbi:MAG TPA: cupin domain-containing protein [Miltoncostaeaceae bacterium]|nr:cupin domain-containing protein [Miltoncostaeaceae bacterium]